MSARAVIELALQQAESDSLQQGMVPGYSLSADYVLQGLQAAGYRIVAPEPPTASRQKPCCAPPKPPPLCFCHAHWHNHRLGPDCQPGARTLRD